jgi:hypothetical protein
VLLRERQTPAAILENTIQTQQDPLAFLEEQSLASSRLPGSLQEFPSALPSSKPSGSQGLNRTIQSRIIV